MGKQALRSSYVEGHERRETVIDGPSLTKQAHKDECDINRILAKYRETGMVSHVTSFAEQYAEMPRFEDFHEVQCFLVEARDAFMQLPARMRSHFENDVDALIAALGDPDRVDELRELGIYEAVAEEDASSSSETSSRPASDESSEAENSAGD